MDYFIYYEELLQMKSLKESMIHFGGDLYIQDENTLIKAISYDIDSFLFYLKKIPPHNHVIKPLSVGNVLYEDEARPRDYRVSYKMLYLNHARTLSSLYNEDISYQEKLGYAKDFFEALKFLHQYIVLGDIHNKNLVIHDGVAYILDLDSARRIDDKRSSIQSPYYINNNGKNGQNVYTDVVKMYLECLSFVLGIPLFLFIRKQGYKEFLKVILSYSLPKNVEYFLKASQSSKHKFIVPDKFYQIDEFLTPDILEYRRKLQFFKDY